TPHHASSAARITRHPLPPPRERPHNQPVQHAASGFTLPPPAEPDIPKLLAAMATYGKRMVGPPPAGQGCTAPPAAAGQAAPRSPSAIANRRPARSDVGAPDHMANIAQVPVGVAK